MDKIIQKKIDFEKYVSYDCSLIIPLTVININCRIFNFLKTKMISVSGIFIKSDFSKFLKQKKLHISAVKISF